MKSRLLAVKMNVTKFKPLMGLFIAQVSKVLILILFNLDLHIVWSLPKPEQIRSRILEKRKGNTVTRYVILEVKNENHLFI